jgi:stalled ribosome rescue protein Dom34
MNAATSIGIWMDHSISHLMEFTNQIKTFTIESEFMNRVKERTQNKSENMMHHKEHHLQNAYYERLGNEIKKYQKVLLFGPTDAKEELFNLIKSDDNFAHIKFDVKPADKMKEQDEHAFVRNHFAGH